MNSNIQMPINKKKKQTELSETNSPCVRKNTKPAKMNATKLDTTTSDCIYLHPTNHDVTFDN